MSNLHIPPDEWLAELFESEYCAECSGDACHHTAIPFLGNWFARCNHAPAGDGTPNPIIAAYRATADEAVTGA